MEVFSQFCNSSPITRKLIYLEAYIYLGLLVFLVAFSPQVSTLFFVNNFQFILGFLLLFLCKLNNFLGSFYLIQILFSKSLSHSLISFPPQVHKLTEASDQLNILASKSLTLLLRFLISASCFLSHFLSFSFS